MKINLSVIASVLIFLSMIAAVIAGISLIFSGIDLADNPLSAAIRNITSELVTDPAPYDYNFPIPDPDTQETSGLLSIFSSQEQTETRENTIKFRSSAKSSNIPKNNNFRIPNLPSSNRIPLELSLYEGSDLIVPSMQLVLNSSMYTINRYTESSVRVVITCSECSSYSQLLAGDIIVLQKNTEEYYLQILETQVIPESAILTLELL